MDGLGDNEPRAQTRKEPHNNGAPPGKDPGLEAAQWLPFCSLIGVIWFLFCVFENFFETLCACFASNFSLSLCGHFASWPFCLSLQYFCDYGWLLCIYL